MLFVYNLFHLDKYDKVSHEVEKIISNTNSFNEISERKKIKDYDEVIVIIINCDCTLCGNDIRKIYNLIDENNNNNIPVSFILKGNINKYITEIINNNNIFNYPVFSTEINDINHNSISFIKDNNIIYARKVNLINMKDFHVIYKYIL